MKAQVFIVWLVLLVMGTSVRAVAQKHPAHLQRTEIIKVPGGSCDACKKTIERAARAGGASYARWDMESKMLKVSYDIQDANSQKIQQRIAGAGFDTPLVKAAHKAYEQLETCCRYERIHTDAASADTRH